MYLSNTVSSIESLSEKDNVGIIFVNVEYGIVVDEVITIILKKALITTKVRGAFLLEVFMNNVKFYNYNAFVVKLKPKKTTDDCYTPPKIYEVDKL